MASKSPQMNKYRTGFWKSDMNLLCHAFHSMLMLTQDAFDLQGCRQLHNQWTKEYTHSLHLCMKSTNQEHRAFFMLYGLIYLSKTLFGILDSECIFKKPEYYQFHWCEKVLVFIEFYIPMPSVEIVNLKMQTIVLLGNIWCPYTHFTHVL